MVSISTHATPSSYTSCGQQHNNKATSLQISSASSQAMILSLCEYSAHPLLSVTAQVASASLFKNCLYRFRSALNVHPQGYFRFFLISHPALQPWIYGFTNCPLEQVLKHQKKKVHMYLLISPTTARPALIRDFKTKALHYQKLSVEKHFCSKLFFFIYITFVPLFLSLSFCPEGILQAAGYKISSGPHAGLWGMLVLKSPKRKRRG